MPDDKPPQNPNDLSPSSPDDDSSESFEPQTRPVSGRVWHDGLPPQVRMDVVGTNEPDVYDAIYIMHEVERSQARCRWQVEFPSQNGLHRTAVESQPNADGTLSLRAYLEGRVEGPHWSNSSVADLSGPVELTFDAESGTTPSAGIDWPQTVSLTPLFEPIPQQGHFISPEPTVAEMALMGAGSSSSGSCDYNVTLRIWNGLYDWVTNTSYSGGQEITGADKTAKGAVTVANVNDTDGDGTVDKDENDVSVAGPNPLGRNEIDLMKIVLMKPVPDDGGNVTLKNLGENVKFWESSTKGTEVFVPPILGKQYPTSALPKTLYVEALTATFGLRQIILQLEYKGCTDTVKATAVLVTKTPRSPWLTRQAADGFPNNPEPGPGKDLPSLTEASLLTKINTGGPLGSKAADGSRYGYGTLGAVGGSDKSIGGRILWEFQVVPDGVQALGVVFDVTRQVEFRFCFIFNGSGTFTSFADSPSNC